MTVTAQKPDSRPTPKHRPAIRVVPYLNSPAGPTYAIEYDAPVSGHMVTNRIECEQPRKDLFLEPLHVFAWQVKELVEAYAQVQSRIDAAEKRAEASDQNVFELQKQIELLNKQLAEARRRLEQKNGK